MNYKMCLILFSLFFNACLTAPEITIGQTYFTKHNIRLPYANALENINKTATVTVSGTYAYFTYANSRFPALFRLNPNNQLTFALLDDSLAVQVGDFVSVSGTPVDSLLDLGYSFTQNVSVLRLNTFEIEKETHPVLLKSQNDYQHFKSELQAKAKAPGSKLIWPNEPNWQLFVDEKRSKIIAWFSDADLMYALDVNMVYDFDLNVEQVYAREWFKGE